MIELDEFELPAKEHVQMVCWFMIVCNLWGMAYFTVFILAVHVIRPYHWSSPINYSTALMVFFCLWCIARRDIGLFFVFQKQKWHSEMEYIVLFVKMDQRNKDR